MKIFWNVIEPLPFKGTALTVGTFDGIHLGHQAIIQKVKEHAKKNGVKSLLVTFELNPNVVLKRGGTSEVKLLTTLEEKIDILKKSGLDCLVVYKFTQAFAQISAEDFVRKILVKNLKMQSIDIGEDHTFGRDRQGNKRLLEKLGKELGFSVNNVQAVYTQETMISSTRIRQLIKDGHLSDTHLLLGRPYSLQGRVVKGSQRGRELGYPTANIRPDDQKLIPRSGIYATKVEIGDEMYDSVTYIGASPTFKKREKIIEVHVHDFDNILYGQELTVYFYQFIRDDQNFDSQSELVQMIGLDKKKSIEILHNGG